MTDERDYVLGTHDEEIVRLGLQHAAWRPIAAKCWERAGIRAGHRVIDLGAGPGYAAFDLARLVGPVGSVTAVERSSRFVRAGSLEAARLGLGNVSFHEADLMTERVPSGPYDAAWCRWVCSFVPSVPRLVSHLAEVLRSGGVAAFHEYADYASWRFSPSLPLVEEYIRRVMHSWREAGGEPDVAMSLPPVLSEYGFEVRETVPHLFCVRPGDPLWRWIATFVDSNLRVMEQRDGADLAWLSAVREEFSTAESDPRTRMLTPTVLEIIAEYRS